MHSSSSIITIVCFDTTETTTLYPSEFIRFFRCFQGLGLSLIHFSYTRLDTNWVFLPFDISPFDFRLSSTPLKHFCAGFSLCISFVVQTRVHQCGFLFPPADC